MIYKLAIFVITLSFLSCTNSIEERAKSKLVEESRKSEVQYKELYERKFELADDRDKASLSRLNNCILNSRNFIDIVETQLKKIDENNVGNVQEVSNLLVNTALGDSLFICLITFFDTAITVTKTQSTKKKIESQKLEIFSNQSIQELKSHYFGLNSKEGSLLLLKSGFNDGLYLTGYDVLVDY